MHHSVVVCRPVVVCSEDISFYYGKMGVEKYAYFRVDIFYQSTQILGLVKLFKAGFGILPNINIQL